MDEAKEPIKIYLDDQEEPFKTDYPPLRFSFSTIQLADGPHTLRVEASNGLAPPTIKTIPFNVRNGVAVTVSGLEKGQTIGGQVELIINAYAGNTEVDFEPRRAETPQPVPTWAWVLTLAVLAWTMFYIFNPVDNGREASATTLNVGRDIGQRLYMDTCARCHAEDGTGRRDPDVPENYLVKKLRDTPNLAVAETPYSLLFKVVTGVRTSGASEKPVLMPAWGPRFTNEEIVAVVNFVRNSWGHDASLITPDKRAAPNGIVEVEENILDAMMRKDAKGMANCCWPRGIRPQLYRVDGPRWAVGREDVIGEWEGYFEALGEGEILDFQLTDVRYSYDREVVDDIGTRVFAMGRIFLSTRSAKGKRESETGRFIRVYQRMREPEGAAGAKHDHSHGDGEHEVPEWALIFDFASINMRVGCEVDGVEVDCPPGQTPADVGPYPKVSAAGIGYKEVQGYFRALGKDYGDAPHEDFWELPYKEFIEFDFPVSWEKADDTIKLLEVGNAKDSNLIKALLDGVGIRVTTGSGKTITEKIAKMPKAGSMPIENIAKIAAWIDAGCPEFPKETDTPAPPKDPGKEDGPKPPANGAAAGGAIGYAEVQQMFRSLKADPGDAPHEAFWDLPYEEFVNFVFPFSWDDTDTTMKLLEPWNAKESNLILALGDGRGVTVVKNGKKKKTKVAPMPKGAKKMAPADIAKLAAWIDAGCPEIAGQPSALPKPGAAEAPPKAPDTPAPPKDPNPVPPKDPDAAPPKQPDPAPPKDPTPPAAPTSDVGFKEVIKILKGLRQKSPNAPHENFWRGYTYQEFVEFEFPFGPGSPDMIRLLVPWDSKNSNMIKAFKDGKGIDVRLPDGSVVKRDIAPMPKDAPPMPPDKLKKLAEWIDAGCPEFAGKPSALPKPK